MTKKYFISTSPRTDGSHTIHRQECPFLPEPVRRILLGVFRSPHDAVKEGRRYFRKPYSCPFCSKENSKKTINASSEVKADPDFISSGRMKKAPWMDLMVCSLS